LVAGKEVRLGGRPSQLHARSDPVEIVFAKGHAFQVVRTRCARRRGLIATAPRRAVLPVLVQSMGAKDEWIAIEQPEIHLHPALQNSQLLLALSYPANLIRGPFHKLNDKFVLTYGGAWDDNKFYADTYFAWEPDCVPVGKIIGTADWVDYCGVRTGLSRVIPIQVFNDTAHSIVAETDHDNTLSFFSEKTAKPLIARRMFVAFSGYKFLHNLRNQGFLTFCDIIDESYDLIENSQERYRAAFDQVRRLCDMDQLEVYNTVKGVLEHNHQHIMNTNWTQFAADTIQNRLDIILAQAS
jgi:hypothetical protein